MTVDPADPLWLGATLDPDRHGEKAAWLSRAAAAGFDVPPGFVLTAAALDRPGIEEVLARGLAGLAKSTGLALGDPGAPLLLAVRASAGTGGGGGAAPAVLNLGASEATRPGLARRYGARAAADLVRRHLQSCAPVVLDLEGEAFEYALYDLLEETGASSESEFGTEDLDRLISLYRTVIEREAGTAMPAGPRETLLATLRAMARRWARPHARAMRALRGEDEDPPLAFIVQAMAVGLGPDPSGAGVARRRNEAGAVAPSGRFLLQAQGGDAGMGYRTPLRLHRDPDEPAPALADLAPVAAAEIERILLQAEAAFGDAFTVEVTIEAGRVRLLGLASQRRSPRAAIRVAVDLTEQGAIGRDDALLRIDPSFLEDQLHPTLDPDAVRDVIATGLPASPGAASGPVVFSADAAEAAAAAGRPAILALTETGPEDIRGMHGAAGVLTVRGGMTSHAALVARGLGRPCVVGAKTIALDFAERALRTPDGRLFREGDALTVSGSDGQVLAGAAATVRPQMGGAFATLLAWADDARRLAVRANADTEEDATLALKFGAHGIGLCRTEHMFFSRGRLAPMRRMIMAETAEERGAALELLRPMQAADFETLFETMAGQPVVIRLLDPPLHEFLPHGDDELAEMAASLEVPVSRIRARTAELSEFNPMLGRRGCRIGIAFPEIYAMQARAIFDAAVASARDTGQPVRPEIMIPLVSTVREEERLAAVVAAEAEAARRRHGRMVEYHIGVMIETPRACLRAGDLAAASDFLSFGTNDLTQMIYGLSRDDAGRFMPDYVSQKVFDHDPFHSLDPVGVGEMVAIGLERARAARPGISIGLCGEHGGDPASIAFCERLGFDYVSCSPYRVPIARLAAAQAAIRQKRRTATPAQDDSLKTA